MKRFIGFAMALCFSGISLWGTAPVVSARAAGTATTYYVDSCAGNDANDGTSPKASWKTLDKVSTKVFNPGDKILFKAGDNWTGTLALQGSGRKGAQNVVGMYGSGPKPHIEGNGALAAVILQNVEYWTISNLDVSNTAATATAKRDGILVEAKTSGITNNIHIANCEVHSVDGDYRRDYYMYGNAAIMATYPGTSSAESYFDGLYIENNYVHDITNCGIKVTTDTDSAQDIHYTNVVVQNNIISKTGTDGAIISHCINPIIQRNQCLDAGYNGTAADTKLIAGLWEDNCKGAVFQYNEIARTRYFQGDGEALDTDWGSGGTIINQYNYTHDNEGGFFLNCSGLATDPSFVKTILRYNVSVNDSMRIITPDNGLRTDIYNNDFYKESGNLDPSNNSAYSYWNNIFDFQTSPNWGACMYSNNCYSPIPSNPADTSAVAADPQFVNAGADGDGMSFADNYKLRSGSACINAGMGIAHNGDADFWGGKLYRGAPDIGAEETRRQSDHSAMVLQSVMTPSAVTDVASGSGKTPWGLGLPEEVYLVTDAAKMQANVVWDVDRCSYDPSNSDGQVFSVQGKVSLPNGVTNPHAVSLSVSVSVTVNQAAANAGIVNAGFETGVLPPWNITTGSGATVVSSNAHSGSHAALITGSSVGINQTISGLQPNTTYLLTAYAKVSAAGDDIGIGVKNYGGETSFHVKTTSYSLAQVRFTTGPSNTTANIYAWKNSGTSDTYVDDYTITPWAPPPSSPCVWEKAH